MQKVNIEIGCWSHGDADQILSDRRDAGLIVRYSHYESIASDRRIQNIDLVSIKHLKGLSSALESLDGL